MTPVQFRSVPGTRVPDTNHERKAGPMNRRIAGIVLCLTVGLTVSPTWAAAAKRPAPTTTTIPTLRSSSGKLYKTGEFCPAKDLGKRDRGSGGLIKCEHVKDTDRWE